MPCMQRDVKHSPKLLSTARLGYLTVYPMHNTRSQQKSAKRRHDGEGRSTIVILVLYDQKCWVVVLVAG